MDVPTFSKRGNGLKLNTEVVLVVEHGRVLEQLDVADVDLVVSWGLSFLY
jgi:hypothetical protein